jgi:L-seryl-tRNA(Ser) seleniumtransferase
MASILEKLPGVKCETVVPGGQANVFPSLHVQLDQARFKMGAKEVLEALKTGTPSIVANGQDNMLVLGVVLLRADQVDVVAKRTKQILEGAVA